MQLSKLLLIACIFCFMPTGTYPQFAFYNQAYVEGPFTWEIAADLGGMNCLTDLGGNKGIGKKFIKDLNIEQTKLSTALMAMINYRRIISFRMNLETGSIAASDRKLAGDQSAARARYFRHLQFQTKITELSVLIEWYPVTMLATKGERLSSISWYVFSGLGFYHFNPRILVAGSWINLWPLHTEGQGFPEYPGRKMYLRSQFCLPVGTGFEIELTPSINVGCEVYYRKLFTDYLDDVSTTYIDPLLFVKHLPPSQSAIARRLSDQRLNATGRPGGGDQRGNSNNNDAYFSASVRFSWLFGREARH